MFKINLYRLFSRYKRSIKMPRLSQETLEKRKAHIIKSAFNVFSRKGYALTSMDDIVKEASVSKGGIYHYFKSKEEIFLEIAEMRLGKRRTLVELLSGEDTVVGFFEKYIMTILESLKEEESIMTAKFSFEFWAILTRDPNLRRLAQDRYDRFYELLEGVISSGIDSGELRPDIDIETTAFVMIATLDGMIYTNTVMGIEMTKEMMSLYLKTILTTLS